MQINLPVHPEKHYLVAYIKTSASYQHVDKVNSINFPLALLPGFLAGPSGIHTGQCIS